MSPVPTADFSTIDHRHMALALRLAKRGMFTTQPNPRVGCVIARGEEVMGQGWHQRSGKPHAEVFALREAGPRARGATAYVTLEPCAHHGRTPPCAEALIAAGVIRVVVAAEDPFAQVDGRGVARLRNAGIAVDVGLMRESSRELNIGFFSRIERGRPWVRVKLAMSLDGRTALASGESKWITGAAARADVQRWRARSSAILTGIGTVLADNPRLTVRLRDESPTTPPTSPLSPMALDGGEGGGEGGALTQHSGSRLTAIQGSPPSARVEESYKPLRVVLDSQLRTPVGSHLLGASAPTLLMHATRTTANAQRFPTAELASIPEKNGALDLHAALALLAQRDINELHVEAGPTLCGALFAAGLVDELLLYIAPVLLGDCARPLLTLPPLAQMTQRWQLQTIDRRVLGEDLRLRLRPRLAS